MLQDRSRNRTPMPAAQPPAGAVSPEPRPARAEAGIAQMLRASAATASGHTVIDLARMVVDYFGNDPIDDFLDRDVALRDCARTILAAAPTKSDATRVEAGIARMLTEPAVTDGGPDAALLALAPTLLLMLDEFDRLWAISHVAHERAVAALGGEPDYHVVGRAAADDWEDRLHTSRGWFEYIEARKPADALDDRIQALLANHMEVPARTLDGLLLKQRIGRSFAQHEDVATTDLNLMVGSQIAADAGSASIDPALAGIAQTRAALDHALAVEAEHRRGGAKTDLPPTWHKASDAAQDAFHRCALKETPNSQAGCQALARLTLDLREGLGLDLEEETLIVLKRIASAPSGSAGVTLKAVLQDRRARADEFLGLMRKDGFVPYPADKPRSLLSIDLAIPYEAERLLAIAQGEFDRLADAYSGLPQSERDRHLARLRGEYRLDELAAVVRGPAPRPAVPVEDANTILYAIQAHEKAWKAYSRANAAYDAIGDAPGQTPASDEETTAAAEAAALASRQADQAWRGLFEVRPQSLHDLWMLLTHIEQHHRDHHGMDNAPDIWGTLTGAVAAIRTESKAPSALPHDLSKLSVLHLSRLYEICRQQRDILLTIEGSPMCEERDGSGYNALGNLVEAEGSRFAFLGDDVLHELERRCPSGTEERNYILEARVNHHLLCNGYIEPELVAEIAAAWGAK